MTTCIRILFFSVSMLVASTLEAQQHPVTIMLDPAGHAKNTGRKLTNGFERAETLKLAEAEGEANKSRAAGLLGGNLDTIIATRMMDSMPELVKSIATGLNGSNLTILNGAEGIGQLITGLVAQSRAVYEAVLGAVPNHEPSADDDPAATDAAGVASANGESRPMPSVVISKSS